MTWAEEIVAAIIAQQLKHDSGRFILDNLELLQKLKERQKRLAP